MNNTNKDITDVDDDLFISKKPQDYIFAEKKALDVTERTNRMLNNTRSIVYETEQVGQATLGDLSNQREALERVENDLDNINSMTRQTQKHLNNMKSFFGGIKSLFSSNNNQATSNQPIVPSTRGGLPRSATIANMPSTVVHNNSSNKNIATDAPGSSNQSSSIVQHSDNKKEDPDEFEANLSEIGFGLGRLKEMAMKLGDEIGDHNEMLDRITEKSERAGDSVKHQNRQIQQLLKKG